MKEKRATSNHSDYDASHTKSQADRFREMAKQLECDEDEAAFDKKLRVIAQQKPKAATAPKARKSKRS